MKNILKEKKEDKEKEKEKKDEEKNNKIEYIFYITLVLLLLYEIIKLSKVYFLKSNKTTLQKGGNPLSNIYKGVSKTTKQTGKAGEKIGLKTSSLLTKGAMKIGKTTSKAVTSIAMSGTNGDSNKTSIDLNKNKLSLSKGIKSMSSGISEKDSYQSTMQEQQYMRGKVFIFGIVLCFFGFLLLSVLPIFSVIFILIIAIAYAKDEFIKFIKSFD